MDQFKLSLHTDRAMTIIRDTFENETNKEPPYYGTNNGEDRHYAVCPACNNPIMILGLYKELGNTSHPYGSHYGSSIRNLATYHQENYDGCPLRAAQKFNKSDRKTKDNALAAEVKQKLIENFDRAVYLLEESTGVILGSGLLSKMLQTYRAGNGHRYMGATLLNIPWIFGYMSDSQSLFGQRIKNKGLIEAITHKMKHADWTDDHRLVGAGNHFIEPKIHYQHHRSSRSADNRMAETMTMVVTDGRGQNAQRIYQESIGFTPRRWTRLINTLPDKARRPRRDALVAMAQ